MPNPKSEIQFRFTPEQYAQMMATICSGLLASGHFTYPAENMDEGEHGDGQVIRGWELDDKTNKRKYHVAVVQAASDILFNILMETTTDAEDYSPEYFDPAAFTVQ
jgi:hypothetical protein